MCVSKQCRAGPTVVDINSNETLFCPFTVSVNNYDGSCNTIVVLYPRGCVPDNECKIT